MSRIWGVVPAAGAGSRMENARPKQFLSLRGRTILDWSCAALLAEPRVQACAVALPRGVASELRVAMDRRLIPCDGGASRAESVLCGLRALPADARDWVLVHDAARPCLPLQDLKRLIEQVLDSGIGGLLAQPVSDTLKRVNPTGRVAATVDRSELWRAQTPQMFRHGELAAALDAARLTGAAITDEASAMELAGHPVQVVEGPSCNLKVTYPADLALAELYLQQAGEPLADLRQAES